MEEAERIRIFIFHGDEGVCGLWRFLFERDERFEVVGSSSDGENAPEVVGKANPDLVISNILAVGSFETYEERLQTGLGLVERLRESFQGTLIVLTWADQEHRSSAMALGANWAGPPPEIFLQTPQFVYEKHSELMQRTCDQHAVGG